MSDSEVAEGAVPEVVESPVEEENGYSGKRERRERRNDANGLPQTAQMQDLFGTFELSFLRADASPGHWTGPAGDRSSLADIRWQIS